MSPELKFAGLACYGKNEGKNKKAGKANEE
jgi:hypothetical protein